MRGLGPDEVLARPDLLAHEHREHVVGLSRVLRVDLQQRARGRVHGRLPELVGVHLAQALEALHGQVLDLHLLDDALALALVRRVASDLAGADAIERRLGDVEVAGLHDLGHVAVEERHQQGADVRAVDVGVRQQDDLVVAQLGEVEGLADAGAQGDDERADLLAPERRGRCAPSPR